MPETELLTSDSKTASSWDPICRRLNVGQSAHQQFEEIQRAFYQVLQRVWKQWKRSGVDAGQLIAAALDDPLALKELVSKSKNHPYARLLQEITLADPDLGREVLLREFLDASWNVARSKMQLDSRDEMNCGEFSNQIEKMLGRMLRALLKNPSKSPNCPPGKSPPPDLDSRLDESLL